MAETIGFRGGRMLMMLLGDTVLLRPGARVRPEGKPGMLPVGEAFLGRAVDGEGLPIDGGPPIAARHDWPAGGVRGGALDRAPVREPFDVGVRVLNALTTFGVGQRIGVMAGSGVGKSVLLDMIAHGAEAEIVVVALIGERAREVSDFVESMCRPPPRAQRGRRGCPRRSRAQLAHSRRHAGHLHGRILPRRRTSGPADHGQPHPGRSRGPRDRLLLGGARRGTRLSAVRTRHDHQAGRTRGQFGGQQAA